MCRITSRPSARAPDIPATNVEIDGVAELWFDDQAALEAAARTPEMKALHADGAKFIGRIKSYVVEDEDGQSADRRRSLDWSCLGRQLGGPASVSATPGSCASLEKRQSLSRNEAPDIAKGAIRRPPPHPSAQSELDTATAKWVFDRLDVRIWVAIGRLDPKSGGLLGVRH